MNPSSSSLNCCFSKRKRDPVVSVDDDDDEPNCKKPKNDVYINYSFEDIGKSFISHLRKSLSRSSFTISDHTLLPAGQEVCLQLLRAIEESEIFVVVFSCNYASSVRCLDELVHIMDCFHKLDDDRKLLPVFLKVEASDVKSQQGPFMQAFQAHQINIDQDTVRNWKLALQDACQFSGLTLQNDEDEADFVSKIVEHLEKVQSPQAMHVTDHPIGVESRAEELISKLRLDRKDQVLVVAVSGISGIGKTTIVKEAYNRIAVKFNVGCFLANIHYICQVPNWKVDLPKELISCLTRNDKLSVMSNHNDSVTKIKRLVRGKKVLLVLDDVDNFEQLEALGINPSWFYNGSRIIVTTRDKRSLGNIPYASYHTMLLNRRESFNLFTRLMLARDELVNTKLIQEVVNHAGGIPLILKVWSRHFKQYVTEEWPSVLETLKRIPHGDVHKKLKLSYDSLTNRAKKLFLDIACFFIYTCNEKSVVVKVLQDEDTAFFPNNEMQYLIDKSLVEITGSDICQLWMRHAIREMGQEIVRQENEDEPGQRTRLWDARDVRRILEECSGTELVESITLSRIGKQEVSVQVESFRKMINLRLIYLRDDNISWSNTPRDLTTPVCFKKLKYMEWYKFPFKSINNIGMSNVVVLRLQCSKLQTLWEGTKSLKKLRILDVSHSYYLTKTGDFFGLENLEELSFEGCRNLKELHSSIGCLHKLAILDLTSRIVLTRVSWEMIGKLPSLRKLNIGRKYDPCAIIVPYLSHETHLLLHANCDYIRSIPNLPRNITSLTIVECKCLVNLPSNISELKSLTLLDCRGCPKLGSEDPQFLMKVTGLTNLSRLRISGCSVSQVPSEIGNLVSLEVLDLSVNTFRSLPDSLSNLSRLETLILFDCSELWLLPLLPSNLTYVGANGCGSLDMMPFDLVQRSYIFRTEVCKESPFSNRLQINLPRKTCIPDWCTYQKWGNVLSFVAPMSLNRKICGVIILCIDNPRCLIPHITPKMLNKTKNTSQRLEVIELEKDSMQFMFFPLDDTTLVVEAGDTVALEFPQRSVSRCGLRLIYDADSTLVFQNVNEPIPSFPSEMTPGIPQLYDSPYDISDNYSSDDDNGYDYDSNHQSSDWDDDDYYSDGENEDELMLSKI